MTEHPPRAWQSMTTAEVQSFVDLDPVVVLPTAALEQHGPHLPLSTDIEIGLGLLNTAFCLLADDLPVAMLPPLTFGASQEHERFSGTLSVPTELLGECVYQQGCSLHRSGVRRLVLSNSHGGNVAALNTAALRLRDAFGLLVVKANYFLFPRPDTVALPDTEWRHGLHGGAVETAMMLHLRPDLVRPEKMAAWESLGESLEDSLREVGPDVPAASFAWLAGDLHPSGVVGNAAVADAETGARLVEYYGRKLADVICDARAFPINALR